MSFSVPIFASIVAAGGMLILLLGFADWVVNGDDHERAVFDEMNEARKEMKLPPIEWEEYKRW